MKFYILNSTMYVLILNTLIAMSVESVVIQWGHWWHTIESHTLIADYDPQVIKSRRVNANWFELLTVWLRLFWWLWPKIENFSSHFFTFSTKYLITCDFNGLIMMVLIIILSKSVYKIWWKPLKFRRWWLGKIKWRDESRFQRKNNRYSKKNGDQRYQTH